MLRVARGKVKTVQVFLRRINNEFVRQHVYIEILSTWGSLDSTKEA